MTKMSPLANKSQTTALSQMSCRKLEDCVEVLRGKNKKYTPNLKAEILQQHCSGCLESV